jgi:hypothetical protein
MQKLIPMKYFSMILLAVILTSTIVCVAQSAHAMQSHALAAGDQVPQTEISTFNHCQSSPFQQHDNGCDSTCNNCACHSPLTIQPKQLSYNPFILVLHAYEPFKFLPEVHLPKFIPPEIHA